jgi:hypothetical protein
MGIKGTKQQDFQTIWTKVGLVLNSDHGIIKSKAKTQCVQDVNATGLYYKYTNKQNKIMTNIHTQN